MSGLAHITLPEPHRPVYAPYGLGVVGIHSVIRKSSFDERALRAAKTRTCPPGRTFNQRPSCNNLRDYFAPPIPISFDLSTTHTLPVVNALKLTSASSILATLGGDRTLRIATENILDRMPLAAAATAASSGDRNEQMQGRGTNKEQGSVKGLQLNLNGSGPSRMEEQQKEEVEVEGMLGIPRRVKHRCVTLFTDSRTRTDDQARRIVYICAPAHTRTARTINWQPHSTRAITLTWPLAFRFTRRRVPLFARHHLARHGPSSPGPARGPIPAETYSRHGARLAPTDDTPRSSTQIIRIHRDGR